MQRFPAAHYRAKATIKACAESGAGIEYMPDAPRFRYTPAANKPVPDGPPTSRGSVKVACSKRNCACKGSLWYRHEPLSAAPMYLTPLTDTDDDEFRAKSAWTGGNPELLRKLLAERAVARANAKIAEVCVDMFERKAA